MKRITFRSVLLLCLLSISSMLALGPSAYAFVDDDNTNNGIIVASGFGAADLTKIKIEQQARLMAKRAASVDAQRNLAELVKGLKLTGGTTMEDFEVSSDIVATRVKGLLKGAFELNSNTSKEDEAIVVEVKMAICVTNQHPRCKDMPHLSEIVSLDTNK